MSNPVRDIADAFITETKKVIAELERYQALGMSRREILENMPGLAGKLDFIYEVTDSSGIRG